MEKLNMSAAIRTVYDRSYLTKYERRLLNKKKRQEAKKEIQNYDKNNI